MLLQWWASVADGGPLLKQHWANVSRLRDVIFCKTISIQLHNLRTTWHILNKMHWSQNATWQLGPSEPSYEIVYLGTVYFINSRQFLFTLTNEVRIPSRAWCEYKKKIGRRSEENQKSWVLEGIKPDVFFVNDCESLVVLKPDKCIKLKNRLYSFIVLSWYYMVFGPSA